MDFTTFVSFYLAGVIVVQDSVNKSLKNKSGEVLATWNPIVGGWVSSTGDFICNTAEDLYIWAKGQEFRGGSKSDRDKWYGYNEKEFQRWWHREGKAESGGNDIDNAEEAKNAYDDWVSRGKPKVK